MHSEWRCGLVAGMLAAAAAGANPPDIGGAILVAGAIGIGIIVVAIVLVVALVAGGLALARRARRTASTRRVR